MTWEGSHILVKALMRDLLICIGLALVCSFLGVYDTDSMNLLVRFTFWTVIMCIGGLTVALVEPLVFGKFLKSHRPVVQILTISAIISIPITVFILGLNTNFEFDVTLKNWVIQFGGVFLISIIVVAGRYLIGLFFNQQPPIATTLPDDPLQKFLDRLPLKFRTSTLYAVSSEGHYLRAYTDKGSTLILMRISDAIKELDGVQGLQIHRSWWVAREGVSETQKLNGRRLLVLKSGETAPVSRSYLSALKTANLDK